MPTDTHYILIVDNASSNSLVLSNLLKENGFSALTANSGAAAFEQISRYPVMLVLLNTHLPDRSGLEIADALNMHHTTQKIPIIFITSGVNDKALKLKAYEAGAVGYIEIPADIDLLIPSINVFAGLQAQQRKLISSEQRYRLTLDALQEGAWDWDIISGRVHFSGTWLNTFGYRPEDIVPTFDYLKQLIHPEDLHNVVNELNFHLDGGTHLCEHEYRLRHRSGAYVDTRCKGKVIERNQNGYALRMVGVNIDITAIKKAESDLRLAAVVFDEGEAVVITDKTGTIIRVNPAFTRTTGYSAAEVIGCKPSLLKSDRHDEQFYQELWDTLLTRGRWQGEIWNKRKNGEIYPEWETITTLREPDGEITHFIACFIDITERKEAEARINYLAHYDELTGLYNRALFHDYLSKSIARSKRTAYSGALIFIDIDRFKSVNDTYGHTIGNELLTQVAKLIVQNIRTEDTAARLCGDEFIILLENLDRDKDKATEVVNKLALKISNAFSKPIVLKQHEILISLSIGVCVFDGHSSTANELIKQADMALYSAKHKGRNSIQLFEPGMEETARQRIEIENGLRFALLNKEFELFFQPQMDIANGKIIGAESLLRWKHSQKGFISPAKFIPVAEDSGLILPLGAWVLEACFKQIRSWEKSGLFQGLKTLSVNISAIQFNQTDFVGTVLDMVTATEIDPRHLEIEITEGALITHVEETRNKLEAIKKAGIRIAIDDFGTGYSSLAYLKRFPIDVLKIDQSFVRDISTNSNDAVIIKTIIGMAKNLGLHVIAEGVETEAQLEFLRDEGCTAYQGFLFSPAIDADLFRQLFARSRPESSTEHIALAERRTTTPA